MTGFGVNTNVYRVAFWILAYVLRSQSLQSTPQAETQPSTRLDGSVDFSDLITDCPHLDSFWYELLHLTNASSAIGTIVEPTRICKKLLKPGYKVTGPFQHLQFDRDVYGEDDTQCDQDRFYRKKLWRVILATNLSAVEK